MSTTSNNNDNNEQQQRSPGFLASRPLQQQITWTEEEKRVMLECRQESFWRRSMPFAIVGCSLFHIAVKRGIYFTNHLYGLKQFLVALTAYSIGKISYTVKCREKVFQQLPPDSNLYRLFNKQMPIEHVEPSSDVNNIISGDSNTGAGSYDELRRNNRIIKDDISSGSGVTGGGYDELRRRNRGLTPAEQVPFKNDSLDIKTPSSPPSSTDTVTQSHMMVNNSNNNAQVNSNSSIQEYEAIRNGSVKLSSSSSTSMPLTSHIYHNHQSTRVSSALSSTTNNGSNNNNNNVSSSCITGGVIGFNNKYLITNDIIYNNQKFNQINNRIPSQPPPLAPSLPPVVVESTRAYYYQQQQQQPSYRYRYMYPQQQQQQQHKNQAHQTLAVSTIVDSCDCDGGGNNNNKNSNTNHDETDDDNDVIPIEDDDDRVIQQSTNKIQHRSPSSSIMQSSSPSIKPNNNNVSVLVNDIITDSYGQQHKNKHQINTDNYNTHHDSSQSIIKPIDEQETNEIFDVLDTICSICKKQFFNRRPKMLSCLHTFCECCLDALIVKNNEKNVYVCNICKQESDTDCLIDNLFTYDQTNNTSGGSLEITSNNDDSSAKTTTIISESHHPRQTIRCTNCDENNMADWYCKNCNEWLCEECKVAHSRVKLTKDHLIVYKTSIVKQQQQHNISQISTKQPIATSSKFYSHLYCNIHTKEKLYLYCETCDQLTCRDCQLSPLHQDHKHRYLNEAAEYQRYQFQAKLDKLKNRKKFLHDAFNLIENRKVDINQKSNLIVNDIKSVTANLIIELSKRATYLIETLKRICNEKTINLNKKSNEMRIYLKKFNHCVNIIENAIKSNNETAILLSKRMITNQLNSLLSEKCEVLNPHHRFQIQFVNETTKLSHLLTSIGYLQIDGQSYGKMASSTTTTTTSNNTNMTNNSIKQPTDFNGSSKSSTNSSSSGSNRVSPSDSPQLQNKASSPQSNNEISSVFNNYTQTATSQQQQQYHQSRKSTVNDTLQKINASQTTSTTTTNVSQNKNYNSIYAKARQQTFAPPPPPPSSSMVAATSAQLMPRGAIMVTDQYQPTTNYPQIRPMPLYTQPQATMPITFHQHQQQQNYPPLIQQQQSATVSSDKKNHHYNAPSMPRLQKIAPCPPNMIPGDRQSQVKATSSILSQMQAIPINVTISNGVVPIKSQLTIKDASNVLNSQQRCSSSSPAAQSPSPLSTASSSLSTSDKTAITTTTTTTTTTSALTSINTTAEMNQDNVTPSNSSSSINNKQTELNENSVLWTENLTKQVNCALNSSPINTTTTNVTNIFVENSSTTSSTSVNEVNNEKEETSNEGNSVTNVYSPLPALDESQMVTESVSTTSNTSDETAANTATNDEQNTKKRSEPIENIEAPVTKHLRSSSNNVELKSMQTRNSSSCSRSNRSSSVTSTKEKQKDDISSSSCSSIPVTSTSSSNATCDGDEVKNETIVKQEANDDEINNNSNNNNNNNACGEFITNQHEMMVPVDDEDFYNNRDFKLPVLTNDLKMDNKDTVDCCIICNNTGDLIKCAYCPRVYHLQCHVPSVHIKPENEWQCGLCESLASILKGKYDTNETNYSLNTHLNSSFTQNSTSTKRKAPLGLNKWELTICERILLLLYTQPGSSPFHQPVNRSVQNYYRVIKHPMDFKTIKHKLYRGHFDHYNTIEEFISDCRLVFSNCALYNQPETEIARMGRELSEKFENFLTLYLHEFSLSRKSSSTHTSHTSSSSSSTSIVNNSNSMTKSELKLNNQNESSQSSSFSKTIASPTSENSNSCSSFDAATNNSQEYNSIKPPRSKRSKKPIYDDNMINNFQITPK